MKVEIIKHQELIDLGRTVKPGDVLESSASIPTKLLQAYVQNGIAVDVSKNATDSQNNEGGE